MDNTLKIDVSENQEVHDKINPPPQPPTNTEAIMEQVRIKVEEWVKKGDSNPLIIRVDRKIMLSTQ